MKPKSKGLLWGLAMCIYCSCYVFAILINNNQGLEKSFLIAFIVLFLLFCLFMIVVDGKSNDKDNDW